MLSLVPITRVPDHPRRVAALLPATDHADTAPIEAAVAQGDRLAMSQAEKDFDRAIARAGRNPDLAAFRECLADRGRRMLHLHFDDPGCRRDGRLPTDAHAGMLAAIRARDLNRAESLAQAQTRQFHDTFRRSMPETYSPVLSPDPPAQTG